MSDHLSVSSGRQFPISPAPADNHPAISETGATTVPSPLFLGNKVIAPRDNTLQHQKLLEGINAAKERYEASIMPDSSQVSLQVVDTLAPKDIVKKTIIINESKIAQLSADGAQQSSAAALKILNRVSSRLAADPEKLQQASALVSKAGKAATQARFIAGIVPHSTSREIASFCAKLTAFDQAEAALSLAKLSLIEAELTSSNDTSSQKAQVANASRNLETIFTEMESLGVELKRSSSLTNEDTPHAKLMESLMEEVDLLNAQSLTWRDVSDEEAAARAKQSETPSTEID